MNKEFSKFEIAVIKRTAQNVNPMVTKKAKLMKQINELQAEYDSLTTMQEQYEASIKTMTGGYGTEDLVDKVIEDTGKTDKNGNPIKVTKYVLKYPDTVVPPTMEEGTVETDDIEKAPLANESVEHGTNSSDLPFMNE